MGIFHRHLYCTKCHLAIEPGFDREVTVVLVWSAKGENRKESYCLQHAPPYTTRKEFRKFSRYYVDQIRVNGDGSAFDTTA